MEQRGSVSAFGQADPTDNRERYDWKSKYDDPSAKKEIWREAVYLGVLLFGLPVVMTVFWLGYPKHLFAVSDEQYRPLLKYVFAWTSGSLGGVLFDAKWLYHVVARGLWHQDRRLWRIFTPHISGGLSFFFLALVASGALRIFDGKATDSLSLVMGLGFLVGYFSDSAIAKLTEVAETLFGTIRAKEKHREANSDRSESKHDEKKPTVS
jgi:hypothetical protein